MLIHNSIRNEVIAFLTNHLSEVNHFYNGLPKIESVENGLPLIAVYLNNANADPVTIGHIEWEADLLILTYIPFYQGEELLDEISEKINNAMLSNTFNHFSIRNDFQQSYDYEYDTENNVWVSSAISYRIKYQFTELCNFSNIKED